MVTVGVTKLAGYYAIYSGQYLLSGASFNGMAVLKYLETRKTGLSGIKSSTALPGGEKKTNK